MFASEIYRGRRRRLAEAVGRGVVLLPGHGEAPLNYADNVYPFRQDSTFLYFFGIDRPDLVGVIDLDDDESIVFGDEFTVDDIIWRGPQPSVAELADAAGVGRTQSTTDLDAAIAATRKQGRRLHVLPPYRTETAARLARLLGCELDAVKAHASLDLIRAVVALRSIKAPEEVEELNAAIETTAEMHRTAMRVCRPDRVERDVMAAIHQVAAAHGRALSFSPIVTVHGETLHNTSYHHQMRRGQMLVNDSGAESPRHYAGDITRTLPVGGAFSSTQRALYETVLNAQQAAIAAIRPGVLYRDVHVLASTRLAEGLRALGCLSGEPRAAVEAGAHALFFPHGLGHMLGLDVHDMESLGEDHVGYDDTVRRSTQFGLRSLRLARSLQTGFVLTVEPGLYFIPALIDRWKSEGRCRDHINYDVVDRFRDAGGIRIEDNVLVTPSGGRVLGPPIAKSTADVEAAMRD